MPARSKASPRSEPTFMDPALMPWALVSAIVIIWTSLKIFRIGEAKIAWPGLDKAVFITLYNKPYAAIWDFQPLATGTATDAALALAHVLAADPKWEVRLAYNWRGQFYAGLDGQASLRRRL